MRKFALALLGVLWAGQALAAAALLPNGEQQFFDNNGNPLAGGKVYFYIPSTLTPKNTWQNSGQTVLNANPVTLDSAGRAIIYGSGQYRQILKDSLGNTIWDQVTADPTASTATTQWAGTSGGTANAKTIAANWTGVDGATYYFLVGSSNTGATTLQVTGATSSGVLQVRKPTPSGDVALTGAELAQNTVVGVTYDSGLGYFHLLVNNAVPAIVGEVRSFAFSACPTGWLETDGSTASISTYSALATALGSTWGPVTGTTFTLPDFRGRFLRGWDHGAGRDPARVFGSYQTDDNKAHTHGVTDPGHTHTMPAYNNVTTQAGADSVPQASGGATFTSNSSVTGLTINSQGTESRPLNATILWCIKY
jgi:microcystin-dependent protein